MRQRRWRTARLAALMLAVVALGGQCLRLADGAASRRLLRQAGLLGFTFLASPSAAGHTLAQWLDEAAAPSGPKTDAPVQSPAASAALPPAAAAAQTQTHTPAPLPEQSQSPALPGTDGWLAVRQIQYPDTGAGARYLPLAAGSVRNLTSYSAAEITQVLSEQGLPFAIELHSTQPQVLIMHTHATECYAEADGLVDPANNGRTTDTAANMVAVGAVLADTLNAAGICTVQDATLHDYPSYNGSYGRSRATVEQWLASYPSIKIVLDVHRDAIETDGVRIKPTAEVDGRKAAQLMIICGADDGTMGMPHFRENLRFGAALQAAVEGAYNGLTRPLLFDYRNYNQQLTTGSILLEVGGHGNTLDEALYTAQLVGTALAGLLTENAGA